MSLMSNFDINSVVQQKQDLLSSNIDDEVVLMSMSTDKYFGLGPVSTRIWQLIEQPSALTKVLDQLLVEFNVDQDTCKKELINFIEQLYKEDLIKIDFE